MSPSALQSKIIELYCQGNNCRNIKLLLPVTTADIWEAFKCHGLPFPAGSRFGLQEQLAICHDLENGMTRTELKVKYNTGMTTLNKIVDAHGVLVPIGIQGGSYTLEKAVLNQGIFSTARSTFLYLTELKGFPGYVKIGITCNVAARWGQTKGVYGQPLLVAEYATAHEAFFLEQALLEQTIASQGCPDGLTYNFGGWTEIRRCSPENVVSKYTKLHKQLLKLGAWFFAAQYVAMSSHGRMLCELNASQSAHRAPQLTAA
jgi:hypothetical protein